MPATIVSTPETGADSGSFVMFLMYCMKLKLWT